MSHPSPYIQSVQTEKLNELELGMVPTGSTAEKLRSFGYQSVWPVVINVCSSVRCSSFSLSHSARAWNPISVHSVYNLQTICLHKYFLMTSARDPQGSSLSRSALLWPNCSNSKQKNRSLHSLIFLCCLNCCCTTTCCVVSVVGVKLEIIIYQLTTFISNSFTVR